MAKTGPGHHTTYKKMVGKCRSNRLHCREGYQGLSSIMANGLATRRTGLSRDGKREHVPRIRQIVEETRGSFRTWENRPAAPGRANYHYSHLMELALTLTLRVYHVVPDALLKQISRHRRRLNRCYRQAYAQRYSGIGVPITLKGRTESNRRTRRISRSANQFFRRAGGQLWAA
jgi:hypothetical protein